MFSSTEEIRSPYYTFKIIRLCLKLLMYKHRKIQCLVKHVFNSLIAAAAQKDDGRKEVIWFPINGYSHNAFGKVLYCLLVQNGFRNPTRYVSIAICLQSAPALVTV